MPVDGMAGHDSPPRCYQYFGSPPVSTTHTTYRAAISAQNRTPATMCSSHSRMAGHLVGEHLPALRLDFHFVMVPH